jgi:hypothetical protein
MARIIDTSDEKDPTIAARLALEVNDPKNCDKVLPDLAGLSGFRVAGADGFPANG